jgi:catechol 2,3-dioxygenase-like lactoylglutathione lyase family enzyme
MPRAPLAFSAKPAIHLAVSDMKRSIDFYTTQLGFFYDHGRDNLAWLTRPELLLLLSPGTPSRELNYYFGWSVGGAQQLAELYAQLARRRLFLSEPPDSAGGHYFFLYDPDFFPLLFIVETLDYPAGML